MDLSTKQGRREQGQRLQRAVERAGFSIEELANRIGCSRALIYQYVSGTTLAQPDRLQQIASECGIPLTFFYLDQEPPDEVRVGTESGSDDRDEPGLNQPDISQRLDESLRALQNLAEAQDSPPDYRALASTCERIVLLAEQKGDLAAQAKALLNLGKALNNIGDNPRAADALGRAVALAVDVGDIEREVAARQSLGKALVMLGRTGEARNEFLQIAQGPVADGRWKGTLSLGSIDEQEGDYREAMRRFDEAAAMLDESEANRQLSSRDAEIGRLFITTNRRNVYMAGGDLAEARALAEEGLEAAEALGNANQSLAARLDLAWCDLYTGRWAQSYQSLSTMLQLARFVGDQGRETKARASLGIFLAAAGDHDNAITYGKDALAMALPRGDRLAELYAQLALTDAYTSIPDRIVEARYHNNQALAITSSVNYAHTEIACRLRLARLSAQIGETEALSEAATRALDLSQSLGARHLEALARCWLAEALRLSALAAGSSSGPSRSKGRRTAVELAEAARTEAGLGLEMGSRTRLVEAKWRANDILARIALDAGDLSGAEGSLRAAVAILEALRASLIAAGIPDTLLENGDCADVYERLIRLLNETERIEEADTFIETAGWPPLLRFSMQRGSREG